MGAIATLANHAAEGATGVDRVLAEIQNADRCFGRLARVQCRSRVTPASPRENRSAIESLHFWARGAIPNAAPTLLRSRDCDSWTWFPARCCFPNKRHATAFRADTTAPGPEPSPGGSLHSEASAGARASFRYRLAGSLLVSTATKRQISLAPPSASVRRDRLTDAPIETES